MTIDEIRKELVKEVDIFQESLSHYVIVVCTIKGYPTKGLDDTEDVNGLISVSFVPCKTTDEFNLPDVDPYTGRDIPLGLIKFSGNDLDDLLKKLNYMKELLINN